MIADIKALIQTALTAFADHAVPLHDSAKQLLNTLGYKSERAFQLTPNNYEGFAEQFQASLAQKTKNIKSKGL